MSQESSHHEFKVRFDETEQRALEFWHEGQRLDAGFEVPAPRGRGFTTTADGSPLEDVKFCPDICGMRLRCNAKKVVAKCALLDCDGASTLRSSVQTVAEPATEITGAYKLFVKS